MMREPAKTSIGELMDIVAAGDDLAAEDAARLCQELSPELWARALTRRLKAETQFDPTARAALQKEEEGRG